MWSLVDSELPFGRELFLCDIMSLNSLCIIYLKNRKKKKIMLSQFPNVIASAVHDMLYIVTTNDFTRLFVLRRT